MGAQRKYHPGLESQEVFHDEAMILWRPEGCQVKHSGAAGVWKHQDCSSGKTAAAKTRGKESWGLSGKSKELCLKQRGERRSLQGFSGSSAGEESTCNAEESACNAGDPGSIPGSGRSPGEGLGYPLWYSWASLVAQTVKKSAYNARDLGSTPGLGRSLKKGMATHSSILAWRIPMD